jgi:NADPH2:quinone reductase
VIERVGARVTRYAVGEEVFGWVAKPVLHDGTYADYIALPADQFTAPKPASVDFVAAAAVPLAASTASIALDVLNVAQGDRVLVVGATGGVGSFFVQCAAGRGAHVIATGLAQDEAYLGDLGATETVERGEGVVAEVRQRHGDGVDALFDLVSREPADFAALAAAVKPAGRAASALGAAGSDLPGGTTAANVMNASEPARLQQLAGLIDAGTLRVPVQRSYPLAQVGQAFADLQAQHTQGKLAITIA